VFPKQGVPPVYTASFSLSTPSPLPALVPITCTPSSYSSFFKLTAIFFRLASSKRLTQTIALLTVAITCKASIKFLSRQVASRTITTVSALLLFKKSTAQLSSSDIGLREYIPGKSIISKALSLYKKVPLAVPTVLPDQLPVCCRIPVSRLKIVLLPVLGLPTRQTVSPIKTPP